MDQLLALLIWPYNSSNSLSFWEQFFVLLPSNVKKKFFVISFMLLDQVIQTFQNQQKKLNLWHKKRNSNSMKSK